MSPQIGPHLSERHTSVNLLIGVCLGVHCLLHYEITYDMTLHLQCNVRKRAIASLYIWNGPTGVFLHIKLKANKEYGTLVESYQTVIQTTSIGSVQIY